MELILQGPAETAKTSLEAYRVNQDQGGSLYGVRSWRTISDNPLSDLKIEQGRCSKCATPRQVDLVAKFAAARIKMTGVARDLERSCPNHASSNSRVTTVT